MKHKNRDIRDIASLTGEDVARLNFIIDSDKYCFRKHYRQGMRSHVMEVLLTQDLHRETSGEIVDGMRIYPRAIPRYMLRILRTRFTALEEALEEIKTYSLVVEFMGAEFIAVSNEFVVEYTGTGQSEIVLCGLQEYVHGAILDPWGLAGNAPLEVFFQTRMSGERPDARRMTKGAESIAVFVERMRKMINESGYIPDLAGNGNLIMTRYGGIKLVDINNILRVTENGTILLDDKGYPSCDKSIEVLWILEHEILKKTNLSDDPLYRYFLSEDRLERVRSIEHEFFESLRSSASYH